MGYECLVPFSILQKRRKLRIARKEESNAVRGTKETGAFEC